ncbi:thiamine phosphate synthase [Dongia deserti]|uniref:thiamine phosphate synthase n=1 Tax=Dongia deserti TaxID=2268030 RepID=UPI000E65D23A|nr:thiamine phosphate synthase [Dongia deserti]
MKPPLPTPTLMVITNRHMSADPVATIARALDGGAKWILLREKDMASSARLDLARQIKADADRHGALLGVNSDRTTAEAIGALNLHLPSDGLRYEIDATDLLLGASVHNSGEAEAAVQIGADYLVVAPVFETESKALSHRPLGLPGLHAIARSMPVPVIALGGILPQRAADCLDAGAAGVAAMGAVMRAGDPASVVHAFLKAMRR